MTSEFGKTWVYEGIVGAIPGLELSSRQAVALQFGLFQGAILGFAAVYDLWAAVPAGTAAVVVAAIGSLAMHRLGAENRSIDAPDDYYRLLFGSNIEVVLSVLAFCALITYLFVLEPNAAGTPVLSSIFEQEPPAVVVFLLLLVAWDLCYRTGTSWWLAVVSLWRAVRGEYPSAAAPRFVRLDLENVAFATSQLLLVPFLRAEPILLLAVAGHVVAVVLVSTVAILQTRRERP